MGDPFGVFAGAFCLGLEVTAQTLEMNEEKRLSHLDSFVVHPIPPGYALLLCCLVLNQEGGSTA